MSVKNNYYVYSHNRLSDDKCFYIGVGKNERVISGGDKRNKFWKHVVMSENGFSFKKLVSNISKSKALELEQDFISQIGIENLTNIMGDGKGNSGSFRKGHQTWNKGLKNCQPYATKKVTCKGKTYNSVNEAIKDLGIGKTTFYRWKRKGIVSYE
jgi:hypothetical protein